MENNTEKQNHTCLGWGCCSGCGGVSFCGLALLAIGGYFLAQSQGWISGSFPFWQLGLIVFGGYLVLKSIRKR